MTLWDLLDRHARGVGDLLVLAWLAWLAWLATRFVLALLGRR